jgi:hypothetical protein
VPGDHDDVARPDGVDARTGSTFTVELTSLAPVRYLVIAYAVTMVLYGLGAHIQHRSHAEAKDAVGLSRAGNR